ncbi:carbamoyltransferase family protein [Nocardia amamiensis]|uniref:carbamoyltransferase family protein n=1 Tax=Nocardia amamiensis TaxID=404578 RepID=UPI0008337FB7|nr:carbamoyltransferase C-terminal domain-containing protein [Nocardia amamiensis]
MISRTASSARVLGLCSYTHDSAAALLIDGRLSGFVEEERLTGDKHTSTYPERAVDWLLAEHALTPNDIDVVAYNFQPHRYLTALQQLPGHLLGPDTRARALPRAASFMRVAARTRSRIQQLAKRFPHARAHAVSHHRAHGLYAFASAGYDEAAVLVVDSLGETHTTTIGHATRTPARYRIIESTTDPASLGYVYGAVTEHLGWRRGDEEGTVMALAALGDPGRFAELFARAIPLTENEFTVDPTLIPLRVLSSRYPRVSEAFIAATCPPRRNDSAVDQVHQDLAAALQQRTEQIMLHLARRARALTGSRLLCVGGGVAANCVAVAKIIDSGLFDELHVPPAPGDSGTAIGAGIETHRANTAVLPLAVEHRGYLGPSYAGVRIPKVPRPGLTAQRPDQPARVLARQLAEGRIVGLFHGRAEAGPRALGNRSILASPLLPDVVDRLNATVKFREPFRPFAPVVLASAAQQYFTLGQPAPYMSFASGVTELTRNKIGAVVHANGTARVQTVTADQNPFLAEVLGEFADITGVPVLINTSLNVKGKPICGTPDMALDCLIGSGLDALMLEGWWITKC